MTDFYQCHATGHRRLVIIWGGGKGVMHRPGNESTVTTRAHYFYFYFLTTVFSLVACSDNPYSRLARAPIKQTHVSIFVGIPLGASRIESLPIKANDSSNRDDVSS